jgi:hypothetical protein
MSPRVSRRAVIREAATSRTIRITLSSSASTIDRLETWNRRLGSIVAGTMTTEGARRRPRHAGADNEQGTFGGPDLRTVYRGSPMRETLPSLRSPVPGLSMAHWRRHA